MASLGHSEFIIFLYIPILPVRHIEHHEETWSIPSLLIPWLLANHINGLVQERLNFIANALELRLPCTKPSVWPMQYRHFSSSEFQWPLGHIMILKQTHHTFCSQAIQHDIWWNPQNFYSRHSWAGASSERSRQSASQSQRQILGMQRPSLHVNSLSALQVFSTENVFSSMKTFEFQLKIHWILFLRVQLIKFSIVSDNGLALSRGQAIIRSNVG